MNAGQAKFLTPFAEGAVDGHICAFLAKAEFFQRRSENHGGGRTRIDRQVTGFSVRDDRQAVGILMQNELGAAISMRHDVLIEGIERDRAVRDRRKERRGKKEDGNNGQSSHKGMEISGASGAVNHKRRSVCPLGGTLLPPVLIPLPDFRGEAEPKGVEEPLVRRSSACEIVLFRSRPSKTDGIIEDEVRAQN